MKKLFAIVALTTLVTLTPGCATLDNWIQQIQKDPTKIEQAITSGLQVAIEVVTAVFGNVLPLLDHQQAAAAQGTFNALLSDAHNADTALIKTVQAAAVAGNVKVDLSAQVVAVEKAVTALELFADGLKSQLAELKSGKALDPKVVDSYDNMHSTVKDFKSFLGQLHPQGKPSAS